MEIEWGPEIAVDGKRPEWLGDGDVGHTVAICGLETQYPWNTGDSEHIADMGEWIWPDIDAIRLPASHSAYIAIDKGFTPWSGGDEAPGDWDGGEVLWRNGTTHQCRSWNWKVGQGRPEEGPKPSDIIGYRRKAKDYREAVEGMLDALPSISPQPIGSAEVSGSNGDYYDLSINGAMISCNDVIDALGLNFNRGEAFKALWRAGRKPGVSDVYDLDKAVYFTTRERGRLS